MYGVGFVRITLVHESSLRVSFLLDLSRLVHISMFRTGGFAIGPPLQSANSEVGNYRLLYENMLKSNMNIAQTDYIILNLNHFLEAFVSATYQ